MNSSWKRKMFKDSVLNISKKFDLDLSGQRILTEAASEVFSCTPLLGALGGAEKITCLGKNSKYGKFSKVQKQIRSFAEDLNINTRVFEFKKRKDFKAKNEASYDIVTNLGFVRPLEGEILESVENGIVALMCESWEVRKQDISIGEAIEKGCSIVGINEEHSLIDLFSKMPFICIYKMIESSMDPAEVNTLVFGRRNWADNFENFFRKNNFKIQILGVNDARKCKREERLRILEQSDVLIVDSYPSDIKLGEELTENPFSLEEFREGCIGPKLIIQFKGGVSEKLGSLEDVKLLPEVPVSWDRMAYTAQEIGVQPVIKLHAGGLKTAELVLDGYDEKHDMIEEVFDSRSDLRKLRNNG
jgi:hypothetical protein